MGTWKITITGHGVHDNGQADDADFIAQELVEDLEDAGHTDVLATFVVTDDQGAAVEQPRIIRPRDPVNPNRTLIDPQQ